MNKFYLSRLALRTYFGDDDAAAAAAKAAADAAAAAAAGGAKFTQADVDRMIANDRKKLREDHAATIKQLEELKANVNLTTEQKAELEQRIETLSSQHLTKEQQAAAEQDKLKKRYDQELKAATEQAEAWRTRHFSSLTDTALTQAAVTNKAFNPTQISDMLKGRVKVVENTDDAGKPNGTFSVKVPTKVMDPKTKTEVVIDLDVNEAVAKLKEDDGFANLFIDPTKGGFGGTGNTGNRKDTGFRPGMSAEEYAKNRTAILGFDPRAPHSN